MNILSVVSSFFRHCALASALILLCACVAERLAPGSVLSYISLWQLVGIVIGIQAIALAFPQPISRPSYEIERILFFGAGLAAVLFLFLIVRDGGDRSLLLVGSAFAVLVMGLFAFQRKT